MKEEKFQKIVEWSWLNESGENVIFYLVFTIIGFICGLAKEYGVLGIMMFFMVFYILIMNGFPKRKVYWRKMK